MRTFCIAGPVNPAKHYFVPKRLVREGHLLELVAEEKYFILHAPRQTGKTTGFLELVKALNNQHRSIRRFMSISRVRRQCVTMLSVQIQLF